MTADTRPLLGVIAAASVGMAVAIGGLFVPPDPEPVAAPLVKAHTRVMVEHQQPETVAVVGDSITAWSPAYRNDVAQSWVTTATADGLPLVGGWALPGATLGAMAQNVTPAPSAYFAVVMGGTNDIFQGVPITERIRLLDQIIDTLDARVVVVSTVAPYGFDPAQGVEWNTALAHFAANHGYEFIDPWAAVRDESGNWIAGASLADTIHPTPATAAVIGQSVRHSLDVLWHGWKVGA